MSLLLLVRHATTDAVGRVLAGRAGGHSLNAAGMREARRLAERLAAEPVRAVYASPLERTMETAAAVAEPHGLTVQALPGVQEIDFGEWTERSFEELEQDGRWREWNERRGGASAPGGESMRNVQVRAVSALVEVVGPAAALSGGAAVVVSHADVIRAMLAHWLQMPLDLLLRLEVSPASVSAVSLEGGVPRVLWMNERVRDAPAQ